uniref:Wsv137-like protein n=1 Tax=Metapenaeus ensis nimavirus TaxID=2133794 RepID=A0A401IPC6_9VIRU|nr:MAG: wsv137-like protein [Metapenaeus ensis nimavirus]GBG35451.1 wsv137-like protein [Metapenaeus ensis nimavirus]
MHEILLSNCSGVNVDIMECALACTDDFAQIVTRVVGGVREMTELSSALPGAKIRMVGSGKKLIAILMYHSERRPLDSVTKKRLLCLVNGLSRAAGITLPTSKATSAPVSKIINYDEEFSKISGSAIKMGSMNDPLELRTFGRGWSYVELDLDRLVRTKIGTELILPRLFSEQTSSEQQQKDHYCLSSQAVKVNGIDIAMLLYDDEAGATLRNVFLSKPEETVKKLVRCIAEDHNDSNPSMELTLVPYYWRTSKKISVNLETDKALMEIYLTGISPSVTVTKIADNAAVNVVDNLTLLLYVCSAKCYSTKCGLTTTLTNDEIKLLRSF